VLEPIVPIDHPMHDELRALRHQLEAAWRADTSFWPDEWTAVRPSFGQCAVTALVVEERFGGEICRTINAGVVHYWNLVDGRPVDLTRDQFEVWAPEVETTTVGAAELVSSGPTLGSRFRLLTARIEATPSSV